MKAPPPSPTAVHEHETANAGPAEQLRHSPRRVVIVALALAIGALALWRAYLESQSVPLSVLDPGVEPPSMLLGVAPSFELIERSGKPLRTGDLRGRVWIADFIFTRCLGPCPKMTQAMGQLQRMLQGVPDVTLVTFSVDPEHDRPEVLREYAATHGADEHGWLFLTGTVEQMEAVQVAGFKMGMVGDSIHHSDRFVLIDREGGIRGYYDVLETGQLERLAADAALLARSGR